MAAVDRIKLRTQEAVLEWAESLFGDAATTMVTGTISVRQGSADVWVTVWVGEDGDAYISLAAIVAYQPKLSPALFEMLVRENNDQMFGHFCVDNDGDVALKYTFSADAGREAFKFALLSVALEADEIDDDIVSRWGGRRSADYEKAFDSDPTRAQRQRFLVS